MSPKELIDWLFQTTPYCVMCGEKLTRDDATKVMCHNTRLAHIYCPTFHSPRRPEAA